MEANKQTVERYEIRDSREAGRVVKTYRADKRKAAYRYADKLDTQYGAVRYTVHPIYANA